MRLIGWFLIVMLVLVVLGLATIWRSDDLRCQDALMRRRAIERSLGEFLFDHDDQEYLARSPLYREAKADIERYCGRRALTADTSQETPTATLAEQFLRAGQATPTMTAAEAFLAARSVPARELTDDQLRRADQVLRSLEQTRQERVLTPEEQTIAEQLLDSVRGHATVMAGR